MNDRAKLIEECLSHAETIKAWQAFVPCRLDYGEVASNLDRAAAQIEADDRLDAENASLRSAIVNDGDWRRHLEAENASLREQIEQGQAGRVARIERAWQQGRRIENLEAALREIAVPLHDLAGNATLMREIARKALAEPLGCPTPGACSCPDGAGNVVSGRLEWRGRHLWVGKVWVGQVLHWTSAPSPWWRAWALVNEEDGQQVARCETESEARAAVEQAVRAAIEGGKGKT